MTHHMCFYSMKGPLALTVILIPNLYPLLTKGLITCLEKCVFMRLIGISIFPQNGTITLWRRRLFLSDQG